MHSQVRFLLGPAGAGKTHRCLADIRRRLVTSPDGPPLLLLAPKQATFQLERRLLEHPDLAGWSRLQILSFDRLARQILDDEAPINLLSEEGRLMVLRALLRRHQADLRVFRASARLAGFAEELGDALREFQRHRVGPNRLEDLAARVSAQPALAAKLHDLALLFRAYLDWLRDHDVLDGDCLPDLATAALRRADHPFVLEALWLDGFAEMTPQETELLAAVVHRTGESHLTFCLPCRVPDAGPRPTPSGDGGTGFPEPAPWLSTWSVVSRTLCRCRALIEGHDGVQITLESLPGPGQPDRFGASPALRFLAGHWGDPEPAPEDIQADAVASVSLRSAPDPEAEAVAAAREIRRHVRSGGRYRDVAILLRSLEPYRPVVERVFRRYAIPYFVDRRESLAHHPLAELTRASLRLAAFQWQHEDWFGILKTGLTPAPPPFVDVLENRALAHGWRGAYWTEAAEEAGWSPDAERVLAAILPPFRAFQRRLGTEPTAGQLATAVRDLWTDLGVREQLESWLTPATAVRHRTAWEEVLTWLENVETGFAEERYPLAEWIPILDAGLCALTAGAIPPSQDQVLIGAIDRSRQPELQRAIVLGANEGLFPAPPPAGGLLSDSERECLISAGADLGPTQRLRAGHERYLGYVAGTRAARHLTVSWAERDLEGKACAPSIFVTWLRNLFPACIPGPDPVGPPEGTTLAAELPPRTEDACELLPWLLARSEPTPLDDLAGDLLRRRWLRAFRPGALAEPLPRLLLETLVGSHPEVSVSALERLAACPFQFFAQHLLRGIERDRFEIDPRQSGSLAHELLAAFHESIAREQRRWRDLTPDEAGQRLANLASSVLPRYRDGLFLATPEGRWAAARLVESLAATVAVLVGWMDTYAFDPTAVELAFGTGCPLPAWNLPLEPGRGLRIRGKIDRVDVSVPTPGPRWFTIIDYKQRTPSLDEAEVLAGIDLQLVAYLLAARDLAPERLGPDLPPPSPAGMFYVGLRNRPKGAAVRGEASDPSADARRLLQHRGRFVASALPVLDRNAATQPSGQFAARLRKDGQLAAHSDGRDEAGFQALLDGARATLLDLGRTLHGGNLVPAPLRLRDFVACDGCTWKSVCRFDRQTDAFRRPTRPES